MGREGTSQTCPLDSSEASYDRERPVKNESPERAITPCNHMADESAYVMQWSSSIPSPAQSLTKAEDGVTHLVASTATHDQLCPMSQRGQDYSDTRPRAAHLAVSIPMPQAGKDMPCGVEDAQSATTPSRQRDMERCGGNSGTPPSDTAHTAAVANSISIATPRVRSFEDGNYMTPLGVSQIDSIPEESESGDDEDDEDRTFEARHRILESRER